MTLLLNAEPPLAADPLAQPFNQPDYSDRFVLRAPTSPFVSIDDFAEKLALHQPGWLTRVSMGISNRDRLIAAVGDASFPVGSAIGNWKIVDRGPEHITVAEDMRVMAYRLTYRWEAADTISAETTVRQQSRLIGPTYWRLATPLHRRFLAKMLINAAGGSAATVTEEAA